MNLKMKVHWFIVYLASIVICFEKKGTKKRFKHTPEMSTQISFYIESVDAIKLNSFKIYPFKHIKTKHFCSMIWCANGEIKGSEQDN